MMMSATLPGVRTIATTGHTNLDLLAAEMVAPKQSLLARATGNGLDDDDLMSLAGEFVCPYDTNKWQAHRVGIPQRGVEPSRLYRAPILTAAAADPALAGAHFPCTGCLRIFMRDARIRVCTAHNFGEFSQIVVLRPC